MDYGTYGIDLQVFLRTRLGEVDKLLLELQTELLESDVGAGCPRAVAVGVAMT
jgi:hypothetical protein